MTALPHRLMESQVFRFLLLGGTAAAINWLARFPLSLVLPLSWAVLVAYMIGMSAGFVLYRSYVFQNSSRRGTQQIVDFVAVNALSAVLVLGLTWLFLSMMPSEAAPVELREGLAHGLAIGCGAVSNFFGHKLLTFRTGTPRNQQG